MKRILLILSFVVCVLASADAQYYSVNFDKKTVAAMATAFGAEYAAESYYEQQVAEILKHYNAAEVAAAGIFASKYLERKAKTDLGLWSSSTENYYYRRIHHMVADKIMPKIDDEQGKRKTILEECHDRWMNNAKNKNIGRNKGNGKEVTE